jgi:hypothetical protein
MLRLRAKRRAASVIREGDVLASRFRIEEIPLGRGISSFVRAWDLQLHQPVAIFFPPNWESEDEVARLAQARLAQEARLSAEITSEHMLRIFHVGTLDTGETSLMNSSTGEVRQRPGWSRQLGRRLRREGELRIRSTNRVRWRGVPHTSIETRSARARTRRSPRAHRCELGLVSAVPASPRRPAWAYP